MKYYKLKILLVFLCTINLLCKNYQKERIIKINKNHILFNEKNGHEIDSIIPFNISRKSINERIFLEIPSFGPRSVAHLVLSNDYKNFTSSNPLNIEFLKALRSTNDNIDMQPIINLTEIPDGKYIVLCAECGGPTHFKFSIITINQ